MERSTEPGSLRERLDEHLERLRGASGTYEFVDLASAGELHAVLSAELLRWKTLKAHQRVLLRQAVEYLTRVDDEEDDVASPIGLDDDREVVEAAIREIRQG